MFYIYVPYPRGKNGALYTIRVYVPSLVFTAGRPPEKESDSWLHPSGCCDASYIPKTRVHVAESARVSVSYPASAGCFILDHIYRLCNAFVNLESSIECWHFALYHAPHLTTIRSLSTRTRYATYLVPGTLLNNVIPTLPPINYRLPPQAPVHNPCETRQRKKGRNKSDDIYSINHQQREATRAMVLLGYTGGRGQGMCPKENESRYDNSRAARRHKLA